MSEKGHATDGNAESEASQNNLLRHTLFGPIAKIKGVVYMAEKDLEAGRNQAVKRRLREIESLLSHLEERIEQHLKAIGEHREVASVQPRG
jgi:hypothetical protein